MPADSHITLTRPDDWHVHLRDGAMLARTVTDTARQFARAIVMPNLTPPITTTDLARQYRQRILEAVAADVDFQPLMTLYLTDTTTTDEILRARASGLVVAVKFYPAGATTNSGHGVTDRARVDNVLAAMSEAELPLLVHGEVADPDVDVFDRERVFLERVLKPLLDRHPRLKVVLEHITTIDAVAFVRTAGDRVAATITAHHLLLNRNAIFAGGLHPHHYCLPVLKRESHRLALVEAATSGDASFFLGTDSAPHPRAAKQSACGCAGIYTAYAALPLYAEVFDRAQRRPQLEAFASRNGPAFYGLPPNRSTIQLRRCPSLVPSVLYAGDDPIVPFAAGDQLAWTLVTDND